MTENQESLCWRALKAAISDAVIHAPKPDMRGVASQMLALMVGVEDKVEKENH